jgi:hypothetical protein
MRHLESRVITEGGAARPKPAANNRPEVSISMNLDPQTGMRTLITDRQRLSEILRDASPVTHVTADDPPTILIHGPDQDKASEKPIADSISRAPRSPIFNPDPSHELAIWPQLVATGVLLCTS